MIERAFYSIREFCERNAISRSTFYRLRIPVVKLGRKTFVPADSVLVLPTTLPTKDRDIAGHNEKRPETRNGIKPLQDR